MHMELKNHLELFLDIRLIRMKKAIRSSIVKAISFRMRDYRQKNDAYVQHRINDILEYL